MQDFMEPFTPNNKIYIQADASRSVLGYVLYQMEDDDSKDTQTNKEEPPTKTSDEEHKAPMDDLEKSIEKEEPKQKPDESKKPKKLKDMK